MSDATEQLETTLRRNGYSLTKPRRVVFDALQDQEPQVMQELVARCSIVDRASIYRTVSLFEQLGIIQRLQIGWKYKLELTDTFAHHHHHASCMRCGKVIPLPEDDRLEKQLYAMAKAHNFQLQSHQLELNGLCEDCQALAI